MLSYKQQIFFTLWVAVLILEIKARQRHGCGVTKKGQVSLVKGHDCRFLPIIFPNIGHLER